MINNEGEPLKDSEETHQAIQNLLNIPKFGQGIGLHRAEWIFQKVLKQFPAAQWNTIKITGSNGKGSTCSMLSSILKKLGERHGLYTSPHLFQFNERIRINDKEIKDQDLLKAIQWFQEISQEYQRMYPEDQIGAFEAFTGIAQYYFAKEKVNFIISEAGIGGRYDPTRIFPGHLMALTSLDLEHTEILGKNLEEIAYDKMDLCQEGGTLVLGEIQDPDLLRRIQSFAKLKNFQLRIASQECQMKKVEYRQDKMWITFEFQDHLFQQIPLNLMGPHQVNNASIAIVLAWEWCKEYAPHLTLKEFEKKLRLALGKMKWKGRFEKISAKPEIYIDVAHSPQAISACLETIQLALKNRKILLVTGVSHNKAVEEMVSQLLTIADEVVCTQAYHRGAKALQIGKIAYEKSPQIPRHQAPNIEEAMSIAIQRAKESGMTILVAGGLFLAIEAQQVIQGKDPQQLHFF